MVIYNYDGTDLPVELVELLPNRQARIRATNGKPFNPKTIRAGLLERGTSSVVVVPVSKLRLTGNP